MPAPSRLVAVLAVACATSAGCSFIAVRGPRAGRSGCTGSYAWPVIDTLVAAPALGLGVAGAATDQDSNAGFVPEEALYVPLLVAGFVYAASAVHGYSSVARCRRAS